MRTRTRRADHTPACEPSEIFGELESPHYRNTPEGPGDVDDVRPWFILNRDTLHCARPLRRSRRSASTISLLGRIHSLQDPAIRITRLRSAFGFALYYYVIRHLEASRVASITLVTPVLALLLGHALNGEEITAGIWIGSGLIAGGLVLHQRVGPVGLARRAEYEGAADGAVCCANIPRLPKSPG